MTYNQALEIDRLAGVNGIDKALQDFDLDAIIAPTGQPAWATDLLYGDHFMFGSSGLAAGRRVIRSCKCRRASCSACRSASASSARHSASRR